MVECRRHLNQRLKETFFRLLQREPDTLPMLVREEELSSPVAGKALRKLSTFPVKRHTFRICDLPGVNDLRHPHLILSGASAVRVCHRLICNVSQVLGLLAVFWIQMRSGTRAIESGKGHYVVPRGAGGNLRLVLPSARNGRNRECRERQRTNYPAERR